MGSFPQGVSELDHLLDGLVWNQLSHGEVTRLEQILISDAAARDHYRRYLGLHVMLEAWSTRVPAVHLDETLPVGSSSVDPNDREPTIAGTAPSGTAMFGFLTDAIRRIPGGEFVVGGLVMLAVAGALWGVIYFVRGGPGADGQQSSLAENRTPSTGVVHAAGPRVGSMSIENQSPKSPVVREADVRVGQRYELVKGRTEVLLAGGTRVVLEGPVSWQLTSQQRLQLDFGKLIAIVPAQSIGFTVATPTAEIVDLGTEFGVEVASNDETRVAVTRGAVSLTVVSKPSQNAAAKLDSAKPANQPLRVLAGQAVTVSRDEAGSPVAQPVPLDPVWKARFASLGQSRQKPSPEHAPVHVVAFQVFPQGVRGNWPTHTALGLDFDVLRPIRIFRLGVFDSLGDGIDPDSKLTVQLWERKPPDNGSSDSGGQVLAESLITAQSPAELKFGYRFVTLPEPLELPAGSYSIVGYGYSARNPTINLGMPDLDSQTRYEVGTSRYAIVPIGCRAQDDTLPGTFPVQTQVRGELRVAAGSFEFEELP